MLENIMWIKISRKFVCIDFAINDYIDQYRDPNLLYKEYVAEEILSPFINYTDKKNRYPIQVIDLRFQVDQMNPKKIQLYEKYRGATNNARLFLILIRHRENKMLKLILFKMTIVKCERFYEENSENDTMIVSELQGVYNYPIYPRDNEIYSNKGFTIINIGSMGGHH